MLRFDVFKKICVKRAERAHACTLTQIRILLAFLEIAMVIRFSSKASSCATWGYLCAVTRDPLHRSFRKERHQSGTTTVLMSSLDCIGFTADAARQSSALDTLNATLLVHW